MLVPILLVLASLALFTGAFAVWVNRQALNTDNWQTTSSKLLADERIQAALGPYLVDQLFTNADVTGAIQQRLPSDLQGLAGPPGRSPAARRSGRARAARPPPGAGRLGGGQRRGAPAAAQDRQRRRSARVHLGRGGRARPARAGEPARRRPRGSSQVAAAQAKLQGAAGTQAKAQLQQRLNITVPATSGRLVIMRSNQLKTAQDVAGAIKSLALVLPTLAILLFALAIWLAHGRRRQALRTAGWCFVVVGLLLLLVRRVGGNEIVDSLVKVPANKPAVHQAWMIATSLLFAIAVALIVYGAGVRARRLAGRDPLAGAVPAQAGRTGAAREPRRGLRRGRRAAAGARHLGPDAGVPAARLDAAVRGAARARA